MSSSVTWLSHACLLIDANGKKILVDPFITGNQLFPESCKNIEPDYIFVSHGHADHIGDTVEIAKRTGAQVVTNPEISAWLENQGLSNIQHIQIGGRVKFPWGDAKMTFATHSSSLPDGSYGGNPSGLIFYIDGKKIYHACDTGLFNDMTLIGEEGIDLAFLPIGDLYTMGIEDSLRAINMIKPISTVPIHYDTFELIKQDPKEWEELVKQKTSSVPILMQPGDTINL